MNRRSFLGAAVAAPLVSEDLMADGFQMADLPSPPEVTPVSPIFGDKLVADGVNRFYVMDRLMRYRRAQDDVIARPLNPRTAAMKSWSTAFRVHVDVADRLAEGDLLNRLQKDQSLVLRIAKELGLA